MAHQVDFSRRFAIPGTLLKDAESLVHLRAQLNRCLYAMTNDVWLLPRGSVEPALHLLGTSMALSSRSCWNVVRDCAHPPPRWTRNSLFLAVAAAKEENERELRWSPLSLVDVVACWDMMILLEYEVLQMTFRFLHQHKGNLDITVMERIRKKREMAKWFWGTATSFYTTEWWV
jgi:hypothetical protein